MAWKNAGLAHRPVVMGTHGMVACAHPLASLAGLRILMAGGNAVDAAVATAAALNVVEPYMSGLGGGGYMMIHLAAGDTIVLDYSGRTSANALLENLDKASIDIGARAPVVPGAPAGWLEALAKHGTLSAAEVFAPAIDYAEEGVALTIMNAWFYENGGGRLDDNALATFHASGTSPSAGDIVIQKQLGATLRQLADDGPGAFYSGPLGQDVISALERGGGFMTRADLENYSIGWETPISATYRGYTVDTIGPPATAFQVPATLKLLEGFDLGASGQNSADTIHLMAEAMKLCVADRIEWAGRLDAPLPGIFSADYATARRDQIDPGKARPVEGERFTRPLPEEAVRPGSPADYIRENTTHFDVIDEAGNGVSVTQSLGSFFGSGVLAPESGILLNNFSFFFDLHPDSPNAIGPDRPRTTSMAPTMIFKDDRPLVLIGTPGAFGILQTTVQMVSNLLDHGFSIQASIEAPRFRTYANTELGIENRVPADVLDELRARGHEIRELGDWSPAVGGGHGILIDPDTGAYGGGADPRRDGYAMGW